MPEAADSKPASSSEFQERNPVSENQNLNNKQTNKQMGKEEMVTVGMT